MAAAPMIGGYLNHAFGFRSNFLAIAIFVLISFVVCSLFFKETLSKDKRTSFQPRAVLGDFKQAFCSVSFWQLTLATSLLFAGYIAFLSGTSVLFVVELGMSKSLFPFFQAAILGAWLVGSFVLKRSIAKWGALNVKKAGVILSALGGLGFGVTALFAPRDPYLLTSGILLYAFGANWIIGLYFPEGMEILPHIKGITASLLTSTRLLIAALVVGLASALYNATIYPLAAIIAGTVVLILPILFMYEKRRAQIPALSGISYDSTAQH